MTKDRPLNGRSRSTLVQFGEVVVAFYNVYTEYGTAGRMSRIYSFTAAQDLAAEEFVTARLTDKPVELWCHSRRVRRFEGRQPS
jgi:hypothetical protein